jgi:hypothetical protein
MSAIILSVWISLAVTLCLKEIGKKKRNKQILIPK